MDLTERRLVASWGNGPPRPTDPLHVALHERDDDPQEARVSAGDGLDVTGPSCAFRCMLCTDESHHCAYEVTGERVVTGHVSVPACGHHSMHGGTLHQHAAVAVLRVIRERDQTREVFELLGVMECGVCGEPIKFDPRSGRGWWHVEAPEVAHMPRPACICEHGDVPPAHPLCRDHGHEDVVSGAYDQSTAVRKRIDRELGRMSD